MRFWPTLVTTCVGNWGVKHIERSAGTRGSVQDTISYLTRILTRIEQMLLDAIVLYVLLVFHTYTIVLNVPNARMTHPWQTLIYLWSTSSGLIGKDEN
jgi:hypothetical protein